MYVHSIHFFLLFHICLEFPPQFAQNRYTSTRAPNTTQITSKHIIIYKINSNAMGQCTTNVHKLKLSAIKVRVKFPLAQHALHIASDSCPIHAFACCFVRHFCSIWSSVLYIISIFGFSVTVNNYNNNICIKKSAFRFGEHNSHSRTHQTIGSNLTKFTRFFVYSRLPFHFINWMCRSHIYTVQRACSIGLPNSLLSLASYFIERKNGYFAICYTKRIHFCLLPASSQIIANIYRALDVLINIRNGGKKTFVFMQTVLFFRRKLNI